MTVWFKWQKIIPQAKNHSLILRMQRTSKFWDLTINIQKFNQIKRQLISTHFILNFNYMVFIWLINMRIEWSNSCIIISWRVHVRKYFMYFRYALLIPSWRPRSFQEDQLFSWRTAFLLRSAGLGTATKSFFVPSSV